VCRWIGWPGIIVVGLLAGCGSDSEEGGSALAPGAALEQLGIADEDAARYAVESLASGYVPVHVAAGAFKALSPGARAQVVLGIGSWARDYFGSAAFASAYAALRESRKPVARDYDESVDDAVERWVEEGLAEVEASRENVLPMLPAESRAEMEQGLESMAAMYRDPQMVEIQRQSITQQRESERASYETSMLDWQRDLPEDPSPLIARRLRTFLETCEDVAFDADLVEENDRMKFENSDYEARPAEWKLCFRAGEESVTAARRVATEWLATLE